MKHMLGETGFIIRNHYKLGFITDQISALWILPSARAIICSNVSSPQQTHVQIVVGMIEFGKFGLKSKNSDKMMINWHFFESAWGFLSNDR